MVNQTYSTFEQIQPQYCKKILTNKVFTRIKTNIFATVKLLKTKTKEMNHSSEFYRTSAETGSLECYKRFASKSLLLLVKNILTSTNTDLNIIISYP